MTEAERTQEIRDQMSIEICNALEVLLILAADTALGERITSQRLTEISTASGRLRAHREILGDAIKRR